MGVRGGRQVEERKVKRHLHAIKHRAYRAGLAVYRFCGPMAGAVRGEMGKDEWKRTAAKALAAYVTSDTTLRATLKDPDVITLVVVPLGSAILMGACDAAFQKQVGNAPTDASPPELLPPPASEPPCNRQTP